MAGADSQEADSQMGAAPEILPGLPPLRLHHLFALTAVMAVMLGLQRYRIANTALGPDFSSNFRAGVMGGQVVYAFLSASALTLVAYGVAWRRRGVSFFCLPGHWLLVSIAATAISNFGNQLITWLWIASMNVDTGSPPTLVWLLLFGPGLVLTLGPGALNVYIGIKHCNSRRWKWTFYFLGAIPILLMLGQIAENQLRRSFPTWPALEWQVYHLISIVFLLLMLINAIIVDYRRRTPRDAAHWCGVGLQFASFLLLLYLSALWLSRGP